VTNPQDSRSVGPQYAFNFDVVFSEVTLPDGDSRQNNVRLCGGAFSEVSGIEATMEPKVIKEGGRNYGVVQRIGPVTFATVVLKRGISGVTDLYAWFDLVASGSYAKRLTATISWYGPKKNSGSPGPLLQWRLMRALPTKFKTADFNATASTIGIEELHITHEGLQQVRP
jgi:phage tail-like protein